MLALAVCACSLLPGLKILSEEVADPECRQVAAMAHATLQRIEEEAEEVQSHANKFKLTLQVRARNTLPHAHCKKIKTNQAASALQWHPLRCSPFPPPFAVLFTLRCLPKPCCACAGMQGQARTCTLVSSIQRQAQDPCPGARKAHLHVTPDAPPF